MTPAPDTPGNRIHATYDESNFGAVYVHGYCTGPCTFLTYRGKNLESYVSQYLRSMTQAAHPGGLREQSAAADWSFRDQAGHLLRTRLVQS
jgi:hypothetical protein